MCWLWDENTIDMTHIYLFTENGRSAEYGKGTYIQQMITCLKGTDDFTLHIVNLHANKNEFLILKDGNITNYFIPTLYIHNKDIHKYYRSSWYILKQHIEFDIKNKIIFHLNFLQEYYLIKFMREDFPQCQIIYTIHFQQWTADLLGNEKHFRKIIHVENSNHKDQKIYNDFIFEKKLFESVDTVITLSVYTYNLIKELYSINDKKIILIQNGVSDLKNKITNKSKIKLRKKLFVEEFEKIILYSGRIDDIKNITDIFILFKNIIEKNKEIRLIISGDGDYNKCLKKAMKNWCKITFTGRLRQRELSLLYQIADAGVILSKHEQCSYVVLEMIKYGLPIITYPSNGLKEVMEKYNNCIFITKKEIKTTETMEKITKILYSKKNKHKIPIEYRIDTIKKKYIELYRTNFTSKTKEIPEVS